MSLYYKVEDGQIVSGPVTLPVSTDRISNLPSMGLEGLANLGWYLLEDTDVPEHDTIYQYLVADLTITEQRTVYRVWELADRNEAASAVLLATARRKAIDSVNVQAGECRQKFMTDIPGQESTYLIKEAEVRAYQTDEDPDPADYPLLNAEAQACGWTLEYTVNYVLQTAIMFRQVVAAVEGLRRGAIITIEQSTTTAAINAATVITWP